MYYKGMGIILYLIITKALSSKLIQKRIQFQIESTGSYKEKPGALSLVYMKILTVLLHIAFQSTI